MTITGTTLAAAARYIMVRQQANGWVVMISVNENDVFVSNKGLVAKGQLQWNEAFYKLLEEAIEGYEEISDKDVVSLISPIYDRVTTAGGRFFFKLSINQRTVWEEVSQKTAFSLIIRALAALAKKQDIKINLQEQEQTTSEKQDLAVDETCDQASDRPDPHSEAEDKYQTQTDALKTEDNVEEQQSEQSVVQDEENSAPSLNSNSSNDSQEPGDEQESSDEGLPIIAYYSSTPSVIDSSTDKVTTEWLKGHTKEVLRRISENASREFMN